MIWTGGCLCGAIRYKAASDPIWAGHCHCKNCQRWTGSPAFTGACFLPGEFEWVKGKPTFYRSSEDVLRGFCKNCASPLSFHRGNIRVTVTAGTLDHPELLEPTFHVCSESELPWAHFDDDLPRHDGFVLDGGNT
ncbi:GFA family protein [Ruegeria denitrificans]|uniref:GFA family protein n=1 Tax=Ruegeria denitrificans TaxID=1715692 RepID=UPI0009EA6414|nr:GFA family protein [Ruegeria denitrificans]